MKKTENFIPAHEDDIVFYQRNRTYGAYDIRASYTHHIRQSLKVVLGICMFFYALVRISNYFNPAKPKLADDIGGTVILSELPHIPVPLVKMPEHIMTPVNTRRNVAPRVVEKTDKNDKINNKDEQTNARIGTTNTDGPPATPVVQRVEVISSPPAKQPDKIQDYADEMPSYIGGYEALAKFISAHLVYPQLAQDLNIEGKVFVQFVVKKDGRIDDIKLIKDIGGGCGKEAAGVISKMPDWKPGKIKGEPVSVLVKIPVMFSLKK